MSVSQVHEALGAFEVELVGDVPREILDTIDYFGHIAFVPGRMDPRQYGDNTLDAARYVGVVRRIKIADDRRTNLLQDDIRISGVGMEFWLGDEDGKGPVIEDETFFDSQTFTTVINALCPDALTVGTIHTVAGSYSGRHQYETPRAVIQYVCQTMSTEATPVGYRVTNSGLLNAGPESDLFVTDPTCIIVKKGISQGEDMHIRSLQATMDQDYDMEDFTTRVVMIAEESEYQLATGSADIGTVAPGVNVYKDLNGNALKLTRLVSESETIETNADTRAELNLRNYLTPHRELTIAADDYDIHGSFEVGDYIYVYDPDGGLVDPDNEVYFRGIRINPMKLRVTESDFPITEGYTVAYRDADGNWTDLTDYIHWEEEQPSQITIGDFSRNLTNSGETVAGRVGSFVQPDSSTPAAPEWVTGSFTTSNYLDGNGYSKAAITVVWDTPLNEDGTSVSDGDHYEINFRINGTTDWSVVNVTWGTNSVRVADLAVATSYDFRVRGIDRSNNLGEWSDTETVVSSSDTIPPSTPAAPSVAASTIAIQVTHQLGKSTGGTYNLENDLAELEVHLGASSGFTTSASTLIGTMRANKGMMAANVPAIETFPVDDTTAVYIKVIAVDTSGNKSAASTSATTTALLVDTAHISDLTVTKVTAGTISSNWLIGANIQTAASGQRVVINQSGIHAYDSGGNELVDIDSGTGLFTLKTAGSGTRLELDASGLTTYDSDGEISSRLNSDPAAASGDYLTLRDTSGETVISLNSDGSTSALNVYAGEQVYVAGDAVTDLIDLRPRGILALTTAPTSSTNTTGADAAGGVVWNRIVVTDLDPTRQYKVGYIGRINLGSLNPGPTYVGFTCLYAWDRRALNTDNDGTLFHQQWGGRWEDTASDMIVSGEHTFNNSSPPGTDLHLGFYVVSSMAGVQYEGTSYGRVWLEDIGPALTYDTFDPTTEGGGSDGGSTPAQTFTKTYSSTWTGRYNGSGSRISANGDIYQGRYSSTNGLQKSLIGFDYTTIASDLSGATIKKVQLTLDNKHWYYNAGGTAVIGSHNTSGSSSPSSLPGSGLTYARTSSSGWAKGATKTVTLTNSIGEDFRDGNIKGLLLGPSSSTSLEYYGYFAGQGSSARPKLKITYEK